MFVYIRIALSCSSFIAKFSTMEERVKETCFNDVDEGIGGSDGDAESQSTESSPEH